MSPADLAEEYDCTNGHIRNLLADLRSEGAVQRVGHGQYEAAPDDDDGQPADLQADLQPDSEGNAQAETDAEGPEETAQETPEPVAGPVPLEDPDTTGGSRATIDEDERAEVELPESDQDDGDGERVDVDRDGDGDRSMGVYIIAGTGLLVLAALWLSMQDQPDETPEEPAQDSAEDETETADPDQWGW